MIKLLLTILIVIYLIYNYKNNNKETFINYNGLKYSNKLSIQDLNNLKKGQKIMTDMFKKFNIICKKNNLKYWCFGGTLIGTIRHKGWIPWDGDIDIGMLENDYLKFKNIMGKQKVTDMELSEPQKLKWKPCSKLRSNRAKYVYTEWGENWDEDEGIQIDIFIFKKNDKYIYSNSPVCGEPDKNKREISDIFPVKNLNFENFSVYVPNKFKIICKELWGNYPPNMLEIDKRYPHEGNINIIEKSKNTKIIGNYEVYNSNDKYYPNKKISLDKKNVFLKLLRYGDIFFQENDIKYSIAYGTLLGFFRNKKFIPYDHDLDCFIGIESFDKLLKLGYQTTNKRVIFNDEIIKYKPDFKSNNIYLILNKSLLQNKFYGNRYNCNGNKIPKQIDRCSFRGIIGRFILKDIEYDIFSYNKNFDELKKHNYYPDNHNFITKMDLVERDKLENVNISVLPKNKCLNFLKTRYGNNFMTPSK